LPVYFGPSHGKSVERRMSATEFLLYRTCGVSGEVVM
jgi:hypothetical protein